MFDDKTGKDSTRVNGWQYFLNELNLLHVTAVLFIEANLLIDIAVVGGRRSYV